MKQLVGVVVVIIHGLSVPQRVHLVNARLPSGRAFELCQHIITQRRSLTVLKTKRHFTF
jgi:hypothetical protein